MDITENMAAKEHHDLASGSEEARPILCECCDVQGNKKRPEAEEFCAKCFEYMCGPCAKSHRQENATHTFTGYYDFPKYLCTSMCKRHHGEILKFYCKSCGELACSTCKILSHSRCSDTVYVPFIVQTNEFNLRTSNFASRLKSFTERFGLMEESAKKNKQFVVDHASNVISQMKHHKETLKREIDTKKERLIAQIEQNAIDLHKIIDLKEEELKNEFKDVKTQTINQLRDVEQSSLSALSKIDKIRNKVQCHQQAGDKYKQFVDVVLAEEELVDIDNEAEVLTAKNTTIKFSFSANDDSFDLLKGNSEVKFGSLRDMSKSKRELSFANNILVEELSDGFFPTISGLCGVSAAAFISIDCMNKYVTLISSGDSGKPSSAFSIQLPSSPYAAVQVKTNKVAITMPDEGCIQFLTVIKNMTLLEDYKIEVGTGCRGIASDGNRLFVSYAGSNKIKILDITGNCQKVIDVGFDGNAAFFGPKQIVTHQSLRTMYVNDTNRVVVITKYNGIVLGRSNVFKNEIMAITVDSTGTVFVGTHEMVENGQLGHIYQLSSDLMTVQEILTECVSPQSLFYNDFDDKLLLGHFGRIQVFKVT